MERADARSAVSTEREAPDRTIKTTRSICPRCLEPIDATVVERGGQVRLEKTCARHGFFDELLSSDANYYFESRGRGPSTGSCCGSSCQVQGAGPWTNHSCTVLIEITERCNLSCPTCFAGSSPHLSSVMSMQTFGERVDGLVAGGKRGADMIQLSGGEPTIHPRLPDMLDRLFETGFPKVTINTNGIRLAQPDYAARLAERVRTHPGAELFIYLQFDGFDPATYDRIRGREDLLPLKERALKNCLEAGFRVHPVMTLTRGINDHEVGEFVALATRFPAIKHVVIQPAMYSGRYDNPKRRDRLTLADAAKLVIEQFGVFSDEDFGPIPCADPNCHGTAVALRGPDGLVPVSRYFPRFADWDSESAQALIERFSDSLDGPGGFTAALEWVLTADEAGEPLADLDDSEIDRLLDLLAAAQAGGPVWDSLLTVSIKPFMDAYTYDQDRIDRCCVHILDERGAPVSLCEFNAINRHRTLFGDPDARA